MEKRGISKLDLKRRNRMQILRVIRESGPISRVDVASALEITRAAVTINSDYTIIVSRKLKEANMDDTTKEWIEHYSGKPIIKPDRFVPGKEFIEYHNDVIFQR